MTSDAKIGLLLGLIFIFIIAFILNGLPGLHNKAGAGSNQATAQDLTNLASSAADGSVQPGGVASPLGAPADATGETIRYKVPLSGSQLTGGAESQADSAAAATETGTSAAGSLTPEAVSEAPKTGDSGKVVDLSGTGSATVTEQAIPQSAQSAATESAGGVEYTVVSGDSPAKIAVKAYGPKEGNRPANIDRLMKANNITEPKKLVVGSKLTIPPLPEGPQRLLVSHPEAFTSAQSSAAPELKTTSDAGSGSPQPAATRDYVVAKGDSLWTISAKVLGSGSRYKEILKLNSDKLGKDGSRLKVGMTLKVPAQ